MNIRQASGSFIETHFHALTHRNFRYIWYGQCISLIGTWMQNIGQAWLVLTITGSPFLLGLVGAIQFAPITVFSLFAGVIIDRFPKKTILLATQTVSMLLAFTLSILVFTQTVHFVHILILAFILGLSNTFDMPTRQSFNIEIVGKEDLMNAIALNSTTFNLARIIGPAIGALMMATLGAGWCFLLNGFSFLAVIYGLLQVKTTPYIRKKPSNTGIFKEIKDGIVYMANDKLLAQTILLVAVVGTLAYNFNILIPVFTKNVLHMGEATYGTLMSCLGIGSLAGALTVSFRSKKGPKLRTSILCSIGVSLMLGLNGLTGSPIIAGILLVGTGIINITFATNANSTLQFHTKDEYRTRVMSVYTLVFAGSTPVGNLFIGYMADRYGADGAFLWSGILCLVLCLTIIWFYSRNRSRVKESAAA
ncbi:Enterobactin exporter EntS [compost metagenome]